jgi:hypothetical protein
MSDTPNHSYNTPEKGTKNWHGPLNENFENLEVDVELRDEGPPGSNSYEPADGAKYLDTVTGLVYLADGNTWTQVFDLTGGGGTSLSGGDGIDPSSISDGDTISVVWNDATSLDANGAINNFSLAADLDVDGRVDQLSGSVAGGETLTDIAGNNLSITNGTLNASGGGGSGTSLIGGNGIDPGSIENGDTLSVAWSDGTDLASGGTVDQLSGSLTGGETLTDIAGDNLSITNGTLNASGSGGSTSLTGGEGINPDSITDGNTLSVASGDIAGTFLSTDGSNNLTVNAGSGLENANGSLQAALGNALGFTGSNNNQIAVTTDSLTVAGNQVSLGGQTGISHSDLGGVSANQHHSRDHDHAESGISAVPNAGLANSSVTVAGNSVSLGGQTNISHSDLGGVSADQHHPQDHNHTENATSNVPNNGLVNSSVTVSAGSGLQNGGSVSLGNTTTLDVGSGRYIATSLNGVDFNGPAEWDNAGSTATNTASGGEAVVAGGSNNSAGGSNATVGGGFDNSASATNTTISGGGGNSAGNTGATVGGGNNNGASGNYATVPGGFGNTASGDYSTAIGRNATANNNGAFVVGDSSSTEAQSTSADEAYFQTDVTVSDSNTSNNIDVTSNNSNSEPQIQFANGSSTADVYAESGGNLSVNAGSTNQIATVETDGSISLAGKVQAFGDSNNVAADLSGNVEITGSPPEINLNTGGTTSKIQQNSDGSFRFEPDTSTDGFLAVTADAGLNIGGGIEVFGLESGTGTNIALDTSNFGSTVVVESSTARHKDNIQPYSPSGGVLDLELRSFEYEDSGTEDVGFIAEEVEEHLPEIVTYDDEELPYSVKYDRVGVHLVPEVRDNRDRLDDIESDHDTVDDRVAELEAEVNAKETRLEDQRDRIDNLEATVDQQREELDDTRDALAEREEHIADLEAENEHLRERLAAIEDHLGLNPGVTRGVADD